MVCLRRCTGGASVKESFLLAVFHQASLRSVSPVGHLLSHGGQNITPTQKLRKDSDRPTDRITGITTLYWFDGRENIWTWKKFVRRVNNVFGGATLDAANWWREQTFDPMKWWHSKMEDFSILARIAFEVFSISVMFCRTRTGFGGYIPYVMQIN